MILLPSVITLVQQRRPLPLLRLVLQQALLAQLLMLFAVDLSGPLASFSFRATSPLMHFETAQLCRRGENMWVRGPDGRRCMQAVVQSQ